MTADQPRRRTSVSFTRRGGRLKERQQRAWNTMAHDYVLDLPRAEFSTSVDPTHRLDPEEVFGRAAPLVVEIGSGHGDSLVAAAAAHPDRSFLALEVWVPGVAQTLLAMRRLRVTNVRCAVVNADEALGTLLPADSVRELWTWFPDPWPKKRHHKRRLVTEQFTAKVARVLEPGGVWRLATDWADYAEQMKRVLVASRHVDGGIVDRYDGRVPTRFERKGEMAGRAIVDLAARRTA